MSSPIDVPPQTTRLVVFLLGLLPLGCAPLVISEHGDENVISERTVTDAPGEQRLVVNVQTEKDGAMLRLESRSTCSRHEEQLIRTTKERKRKADAVGATFAYVAAGLGLIGGPMIFADVHNIPTANDPMTTNPVGRAGAIGIGTAITVAGAGMLALAIGTSVRGRDSITEEGQTWRKGDVVGSDPACDVAMVAKQAVVVRTENPSGQLAIGTTGKMGQLTVRWSDFDPVFPSGKVPAGATIEVDGMSAAFDLGPAQRYLAQQALKQAEDLATEDKVDEATERANEAEALGSDAKVARAMIAGAPTSMRRKQEAEETAHANEAERQREINRHTARAHDYVRKNDPDRARPEVDQVAALGGDTAALREAIDLTPKERQRKQESDRLATAQQAAAQRELESSRPSDLEMQFPVRIGDSWASATSALRAVSASCRLDTTSGHHMLRCEGVSIPGLEGTFVKSYAMTLDDTQVSETGGDASIPPSRIHCDALLKQFTARLGAGWRIGATKGNSVFKSLEAVRTGDRWLGLDCSERGQRYGWSVGDAWANLRTDATPSHTVAILALDVIVEFESMRRSRGLSPAEVVESAYSVFRDRLAPVAGRATKLSDRSRRAFETYRITVLNKEWFSREYYRVVR